MNEFFTIVGLGSYVSQKGVPYTVFHCHYDDLNTSGQSVRQIHCESNLIIGAPSIGATINVLKNANGYVNAVIVK